MQITLNLRGIKDIEKTISKLAPELQKAAYKAVISAGARVVLREAKSRVAVDTGTLKRSLAIKAKVFGSTPYAVIGPRLAKTKKRGVSQAKNSASTTWINAYRVEYGTSTARAQPFMRPALDASRGKVHAEFRKGLEKYLHRTAKRLAKKSA
jgi:HK97 gp10 family phage protein